MDISWPPHLKTPSRSNIINCYKKDVLAWKGQTINFVGII